MLLVLQMHLFQIDPSEIRNTQFHSTGLLHQFKYYVSPWLDGAFFYKNYETLKSIHEMATLRSQTITLQLSGRNHYCKMATMCFKDNKQNTNFNLWNYLVSIYVMVCGTAVFSMHRLLEIIQLNGNITRKYKDRTKTLIRQQYLSSNSKDIFSSNDWLFTTLHSSRIKEAVRNHKTRVTALDRQNFKLILL